MFNLKNKLNNKRKCKKLVSLYDLIYYDNLRKFLEPYNVMGVYAIYTDNELVYIGASKNIGKRWCIHKHHIIKPYKECSKLKKDFLPVYVILREKYYSNKNIYFKIIKIVKNETLLKKKELHYIQKFNPKYNVRY